MCQTFGRRCSYQNCSFVQKMNDSTWLHELLFGVHGGVGVCMFELCLLINVSRFHANIWPMLGKPLWIYQRLLSV